MSLKNLDVQIVRCADDQHYPVWVECEFRDAEGRRHAIIDKVPVFTLGHLDSKSVYPQPAGVRCEVLNAWHDAGRELARITIDSPDHIESAEALSEFVVLAAQLADLRGPIEKRIP
jgi:hypothetical protein